MADYLNAANIEYTQPEQILQDYFTAFIIENVVVCKSSVVNTAIIIKSISEYHIPLTIMDIS